MPGERTPGLMPGETRTMAVGCEEMIELTMERLLPSQFRPGVSTNPRTASSRWSILIPMNN
jgi:hypothetical protein